VTFGLGRIFFDEPLSRTFSCSPLGVANDSRLSGEETVPEVVFAAVVMAPTSTVQRKCYEPGSFKRFTINSEFAICTFSLLPESTTDRSEMNMLRDARIESEYLPVTLDHA